MPSRYAYSKWISNSYLGLSKEVKGQTSCEVDMKAREQLRKWSEREQREKAKSHAEDLKEQAAERTRETQALTEQYRSILAHTLTHSDRVYWNALIDRKPYKSFRFGEKEPVEEPVSLQVPPKTWLETLFPAKRAFRLQREEELVRLKEQHQKEFMEQKLIYETKKAAAHKGYLEDKAAYEADQQKRNEEVDALRFGYEAKEPSRVENYIRLVLENSEYPDGFEKDYDVQCEPNSMTIVVDYRLPHPDSLPNVAEFRYSAKEKSVKQVPMRKKESEAFYESVLYQVALRSVHEVYESDYENTIETVVFNGWVEGTDPATGQDFTSCLLSLQTGREEFLAINLAKVDPKQCFRNLKGLSAGPLHNLAPVRPILQIKREDKRFVEARDVLAEIDSVPNLATMDWEDFEHLVRGLFEKVFSQGSAEVKITRASRDYGVDAVAFDPDPIRGGKFVIQAKRYNDVVPVSAVRDLYGTMINEGAVKGILVTTAYYGAESRNFAKDKPLTLIDGSNLIHMLSEHGYKARIELSK